MIQKKMVTSGTLFSILWGWCANTVGVDIVTSDFSWSLLRSTSAGAGGIQKTWSYKGNPSLAWFNCGGHLRGQVGAELVPVRFHEAAMPPGQDRLTVCSECLHAHGPLLVVDWVPSNFPSCDASIGAARLPHPGG